MSTPKPTAAKTPAIRSCPETRPLDNKDKLPAGIDAVNGSTGSSTAAALFPTLVGIPSNALDELAVALASFSGNRGALPFLNVYNSLAIDFMSRSGLAVDEPAPSVCPTLFGSPEDLEAKRLYATVLAFLFNQQIRANELTVSVFRKFFSLKGNLKNKKIRKFEKKKSQLFHRERKRNRPRSVVLRQRRLRSQSENTSKGFVVVVIFVFLFPSLSNAEYKLGS